MISLEHVRTLIEHPPEHTPGRPVAFCDFAGPGDESVLALANGNQTQIVDAWRSRDTMHSVGKFLDHFRRLGLAGYDIGGDEGGMGHVILDRLQEQNFFLKRINNGSPAKRSEIYANLSVEWWSIAGQLIERRQIILPNDEKLVAQLTSRRKMYDSRGRERLESKADLRARGVESPDRADALIGAIIMAQGRQSSQVTARELREILRRSRPGPGRYGGVFGRTHLDW
jgi:hypothetical protein